MTRCPCGADHAADKRAGAERERVRRVERWGAPFETLTGERVLRQMDMVELRAVQAEGGAWEASVYAAEYVDIAGCEVGAVEFHGFAATEDRAQKLARDAAETLLRKWDGWREQWAQERAEREAAR